MNRRQMLISAAGVAAYGILGPSSRPPAAVAQTKPADVAAGGIDWHDVREWGIEGKGFNDTESYFDRLPARAKSVVVKRVWELSQNTSGMSAHFEADAPSIHIRYTLTSENLAMRHMPATGVSGVDLYGRDDAGWHWLGTAQPGAQTVTAELAAKIAPGRRAYHVNFPLYNGVKSLEIGVTKGAAFSPVSPRKDKPVVWYGTSITQGGCASRPGMSFPAILGRRMNTPILNFGFSGSGRMELEVGRFLAELDPAIYVIDCLANMGPEQVGEQTVPLVKQLRGARPDTPILLLDERTFAQFPLVPETKASHARKADALKKRYDELVAAGVTRVYFRGGDDLMGSDGEGTVDGSHPNDLGMMRYADALGPTLRAILSGKSPG